MEEQLCTDINDASSNSTSTGELDEVISEFPFFSTTVAFSFFIKLA